MILIRKNIGIEIPLIYNEYFGQILNNQAKLNIKKITVDNIPVGFKGAITAFYINEDAIMVNISKGIIRTDKENINSMQIGDENIVSVDVQLVPYVDIQKHPPVYIKVSFDIV